MGSKPSNHKFFPIIEGETIDLCAPNLEEWVLEDWSQWMNDSETTRYLRQGVYPNTLEAQKNFVEDAHRKGDRILFLIRPKNGDRYIGVGSLSFIDPVMRSCHIAHILGKTDDNASSDAMFYSLEIKCRLAEHAFEKLGMERIQTSQVTDLMKWQRWQPVFGFKPEGILRKAFRKGQTAHDVVYASCLLADYLKLKELRGGTLWPGKTRLFEILKNFSTKDTSVDRLSEFLKNEHQVLDRQILELK